MNDTIAELRKINEENRKINGELREENKQLKEEIKILKMIVYGLDVGDLFPTEICKLIAKIGDEINWDEYLKFQGDK